VKVKIHMASGPVLDATTDSDGHVHIDDHPPGAYTVEILDARKALTDIDLRVEDAKGVPLSGASGKVTFSDGTEVVVMTDAHGEVHLTDVPAGSYTFKLDEDVQPPAPKPAPAEEPATDEEDVPAVIDLVLVSEAGVTPLENVPLTIEGHGQRWSGSTDSNGTFRQGNVPSAEYLLTVGDASFWIPAVAQGSPPHVIHVPHQSLAERREGWRAPTDEERREQEPAPTSDSDGG
jgi:hypothetical protein